MVTTEIRPGDVLARLGRHLLVDGLDLVLDLDASEGCWVVDARDGTRYLDMFGFFASNALGMNHPALHTAAAESRLLAATRHKPSNSDVYSAIQAEFVDTFEAVLGDERLPYLFLIEGGALAVENALKAAFDWKSRHNEAAGRDPALGSKVLHLTGAFHGRTGYTMSLTNTDPVKTDRFPTFAWPRITAPVLAFPRSAHEADNRRREDRALREAAAALDEHRHDVACFIAEPIQAEGGDGHLSGRFLREMQELCRRHDVLFAVDEVQTGVGACGTPWCYQQLGVEPDLVAFGKKTHVCGTMAGGRIDEVDEHVFATSGRLNSTFGGGLADMGRATITLQVIRDEGLIEAAAERGDTLLAGLQELEQRHTPISGARGRGLLCAFDLPDRRARTRLLERLFSDEQVLMIGCGQRTVRFRPPLIVGNEEIDRALEALDATLGDL